MTGDGVCIIGESPEDDVELLRQWGVQFSIMNEDEAVSFLENEEYTARLVPLLGLFRRSESGEGPFVSLDFAYLADLARIDQCARDTLLPMALDCEHFLKVRLVASYERSGHSGPGVSSPGPADEFVASLSRRRRQDILLSLQDEETFSDAGSGFLTATGERLRFQLLVDSVMFGTLVSLLLFCARRWNDSELLGFHYLARCVHPLRNRCAHGASILACLNPARHVNHRADRSLMQSLSRAGISRRRRQMRMENEGLNRMTSLAYLHSRLASRYGGTSPRLRHDLKGLFERAMLHREWYGDRHPLVYSMDFLREACRVFYSG